MTAAPILEMPNVTFQQLADWYAQMEVPATPSTKRAKGPCQQDEETLRAALECALSSLSPRQAMGFRLYAGVDGTQHTLEEAGAAMGVTRERVRQLRDQAWKKIVASHPEVESITFRIDALLADRTTPLELETLEREDRWFAGFSTNRPLLTYLIDCVSDGAIGCREIAGRTVISYCTREIWGALRVKGREVLRATFAQGGTQGEAWALLEAQTKEVRTGELTGLLWETLMGAPCSGADQVLRSASKSRSARIAGVLRSAPAPMLLVEIARAIGEEEHLLAEGQPYARRLRNDIRAAGGLVFGRSRYGLREHITLTDHQCQAIVDAVEQLVQDATTDRQWHSAELLSLLHVEEPDLVHGCDPFLLSLILDRSQLLRYQGFLVWCVKESEGIAADRLQILPAVEAALVASGRPMKTQELREAVEQVRGLNTLFLLAPRGRLVRVGPGWWGLVDRDIDLRPSVREQLMNRLADVLHTRQQGLHLSELEDALYATTSDADARLDGGRIWGLAQRDARFFCAHGALLGLAEWGSARRLTIYEAGQHLRKEGVDELSTDMARSHLEALTGRPLVRQQISITMKSSGYAFDHDSRVYRLSADPVTDEPDY